jgi:hypothetical protein
MGDYSGKAATGMEFMQHKVEQKRPDFYVTGKVKVIGFKDLWPVRDRKQIHQSEKHYWRTNERVQYTIHEDRATECAIVVAIDTTKQEVRRSKTQHKVGQVSSSVYRNSGRCT